MLKKSLSVFAGLALATSVFSPVANAQAAQQVLIASCTQTVAYNNTTIDFHGSTPGAMNNIPVNVTAPEKAKVGVADTIKVEIPQLASVSKSANVIQKALQVDSTVLPFVFFDNFSMQLNTGDATNSPKLPGKVDLGQAKQVNNKVVYDLAFGDPIEIAVTPTTATEEGKNLDVVVESLSFDILGSTTADGPTTKASTVNCTFSAEGTNFFNGNAAVTNGNVLASYPVEKADSTTPGTDNGSDTDGSANTSSDVDNAGALVALIAGIVGLITIALPFLAKIFPDLKKIFPGLRF